MLGGMWGAHVSLDRNLSSKIYELISDKSVCLKYNLNGTSEKGYDQFFLKDFVYPLILNKSTIHDSYTCAKFPNTRPFPNQRKVTEFIGSVHTPGFKRNFTVECPIECRPKNHLDWTTC